MFLLNTLKLALTGTKPGILTPESYDHPRQFLYKGSPPGYPASKGPSTYLGRSKGLCSNGTPWAHAKGNFSLPLRYKL